MQIKLQTILLSTLLTVSTAASVSAQEQPSLRSSALKLIDSLDDDTSLRLYSHKSAIVWLCQNGRYEAAVEQTKSLPLDERIQLLLLISSLAVDAEQTDAANKLLAGAFSTIADHSADEARHEQATSFAELAIKNENLALATRFVSIINEASLRKSRILLKLAHAYSHVKDNKQQAIAYIDEALARTSKFDKDEESEVPQLTVEAAKLLLSLGSIERARELGAKAHSALLERSVPETDDQIAVASLWSAVGHMSQAVGMIDSLAVSDRALAFGSFAMQSNDEETTNLFLEKSKELLLNETTDSYSRSIDLSRLIGIYVKLNHLDEALVLLPKITDAYHLHTSAVATSDALRMYDRTSDAHAALDIATRAAEKIVSEKSEDIPGYASTSAAKTKSLILSRLVDSYIILGSLSRAELAAEAIDHPQYRASAISRVAVGYADKGDCSKARNLLQRALTLSTNAKEYNHDQSKEEGIFNVARGMREAGFVSDFASALTRFLEQIQRGDLADQYFGHLFILGDMAESAGVQLNRKSRSLLKQIESK